MKHLVADELRRFGKRGEGRVDKRIRHIGSPAMMVIRFGVYFDESIDRQRGNTMLRHEPAKSIIEEWLSQNISGPYSIQTSYVFFEDEDDALLCFMAFR